LETARHARPAPPTSRLRICTSPGRPASRRYVSLRSTDEPHPSARAIASVKQAVHDGDTVSASSNSFLSTRLLGVDTPDVSFSLPGEDTFPSGPLLRRRLCDAAGAANATFDPPVSRCASRTDVEPSRSRLSQTRLQERVADVADRVGTRLAWRRAGRPQRPCLRLQFAVRDLTASTPGAVARALDPIVDGHGMATSNAAACRIPRARDAARP
jgi:hypothetical protein